MQASPRIIPGHADRAALSGGSDRQGSDSSTIRPSHYGAGDSEKTTPFRLFLINDSANSSPATSPACNGPVDCEQLAPTSVDESGLDGPATGPRRWHPSDAQSQSFTQNSSTLVPTDRQACRPGASAALSYSHTRSALAASWVSTSLHDEVRYPFRERSQSHSCCPACANSPELSITPSAASRFHGNGHWLASR